MSPPGSGVPPSDNVGLLPSYLRRHIQIGFDSDDISALISSIDSSQGQHGSTSPHLPAEILFHILEYVPIDHVLTWRLVCGGFRDCVDGPVMYEYLRRAEIIGYLGPSSIIPLSGLNSDQYEELHLLRAHFERLEGAVTPKLVPAETEAKWSASHAIFQIDSQWMQRYRWLMNHKVTQPATSVWESLFDDFQVIGEELRHGTLRWCIRLDKAVLDLEFPLAFLRRSIEIDLDNARIMFKWREILFRFIKTETLLRKIEEEKLDSRFTFSQKEDCLREVRRRRLCAALDLNDGVHRRLNWEMNLLPPLFGKRRYDQAAAQFNNLEEVENDAIAVLSILRKEAAMSAKEVAYLKSLCEDRVDMETDLRCLDRLFGQWKSTLFNTGTWQPTWSPRLATVPRNPLAWTDQVTRTEAEQVRRWKSQKQTISQLALLLAASKEALSLPENTFDELGSDP